MHTRVSKQVRLQLLPHAARLLREAMTCALPLSVPAKVCMRAGQRWGSLEAYE